MDSDFENEFVPHSNLNKNDWFIKDNFSGSDQARVSGPKDKMLDPRSWSDKKVNQNIANMDIQQLRLLNAKIDSSFDEHGGSSGPFSKNTCLSIGYALAAKEREHHAQFKVGIAKSVARTQLQREKDWLMLRRMHGIKDTDQDPEDIPMVCESVGRVPQSNRQQSIDSTDTNTKPKLPHNQSEKSLIPSPSESDNHSNYSNPINQDDERVVDGGVGIDTGTDPRQSITPANSTNSTHQTTTPPVPKFDGQNFVNGFIIDQPMRLLMGPTSLKFAVPNRMSLGFQALHSTLLMLCIPTICSVWLNQLNQLKDDVKEIRSMDTDFIESRLVKYSSGEMKWLNGIPRLPNFSSDSIRRLISNLRTVLSGAFHEFSQQQQIQTFQNIYEFFRQPVPSNQSVNPEEYFIALHFLLFFCLDESCTEIYAPGKDRYHYNHRRMDDIEQFVYEGCSVVSAVSKWPGTDVDLHQCQFETIRSNIFDVPAQMDSVTLSKKCHTLNDLLSLEGQANKTATGSIQRWKFSKPNQFLWFAIDWSKIKTTKEFQQLDILASIDASEWITRDFQLRMIWCEPISRLKAGLEQNQNETGQPSQEPPPQSTWVTVYIDRHENQWNIVEPGTDGTSILAKLNCVQNMDQLRRYLNGQSDHEEAAAAGHSIKSSSNQQKKYSKSKRMLRPRLVLYEQCDELVRNSGPPSVQNSSFSFKKIGFHFFDNNLNDSNLLINKQLQQKQQRQQQPPQQSQSNRKAKEKHSLPSQSRTKQNGIKSLKRKPEEEIGVISPPKGHNQQQQNHVIINGALFDPEQKYDMAFKKIKSVHLNDVKVYVDKWNHLYKFICDKPASSLNVDNNRAFHGVCKNALQRNLSLNIEYE